MTDALKQAIERLQQMPEERQDMLALLMLHEIAEGEHWAKTTEVYTSTLDRFVDKTKNQNRSKE